MGVQDVHLGVLGDDLLHHTDVVLLQFGVKAGNIGEIGSTQLLHALPSALRVGLDHEGLLTLEEAGQVLFGGLGEVQPIPAHTVGEGGVKVLFVVEQVVVGPVV